MSRIIENVSQITYGRVAERWREKFALPVCVPVSVQPRDVKGSGCLRWCSPSAHNKLRPNCESRYISANLLGEKQRKKTNHYFDEGAGPLRLDVSETLICVEMRHGLRVAEN